MKISNKRKEYFEIGITLNEAEVQALVDVFEYNCYLRDVPFDQIGGLRGELYEQLKAILVDDQARQ